MKSETPSVRVSVASLDRVWFPHPLDGTPILALEQQATVQPGGEIAVKAHPFGGGVHILNPHFLKGILGNLEFDSDHSQAEADFRLLIPSNRWQALKEYCLEHLSTVDDPYLESTPDRELVEEFAEAIQVDLRSGQYTVRRAGFVMENRPVPTLNIHTVGLPSLHIYQLFEVEIVDASIIHRIQEVGRRDTDGDLRSRAREAHLKDGKGRLNSILSLPLDQVIQGYLQLPEGNRFHRIQIEGHWLDESTLAILPEVEVEPYQRITGSNPISKTPR